MAAQNFKNHAQFVPLFHLVSFFLAVAILIGSFVNLAQSSPDNLYSASLICAISVLLALYFWFIRSFPMKVQDRAIRAEEGLRHFLLTQKLLDARLRMSQIVALRFASDAEFPALAQRAVAENMSSKAIKEAIQNWRADYDGHSFNE